jgi:predicted secreted protein
MVFRQAVSAEDVYLGMGNKNPTTASCEELVVRTTILSSNSCMPTYGGFFIPYYAAYVVIDIVLKFPY